MCDQRRQRLSERAGDAPLDRLVRVSQTLHPGQRGLGPLRLMLRRERH